MDDADLQRPASLAEILMVCTEERISANRGGVHKYLIGTEGASHSKDHLGNPSPKCKGHLSMNMRLALLLRLPALARPPNMVREDGTYLGGSEGSRRSTSD